METITVNDGNLELRIDGSYSAEEARQLLERIGEARSKIANDPPLPDRIEVTVAFDPPVFSAYDLRADNRLTVYVQHPLFGWMAVVLDVEGVSKLRAIAAQYLRDRISTAMNPDTSRKVGDDTRH